MGFVSLENFSNMALKFKGSLFSHCLEQNSSQPRNDTIMNDTCSIAFEYTLNNGHIALRFFYPSVSLIEVWTS